VEIASDSRLVVGWVDCPSHVGRVGGLDAIQRAAGMHEHMARCLILVSWSPKRKSRAKHLRYTAMLPKS